MLPSLCTLMGFDSWGQGPPPQGLNDLRFVLGQKADGPTRPSSMAAGKGAGGRKVGGLGAAHSGKEDNVSIGIFSWRGWLAYCMFSIMPIFAWLSSAASMAMRRRSG